MIVPHYYKRFKCIGGLCKNNCCKGGWEIEVDEAALERFAAIKGEFGDRVRSAINEENIFKHIDGHCPLLSNDGLCEMVKNNQKLCVICDEYPRFTEYYEDYCERGISLSCEAAAEIILNDTEKLSLVGNTGVCKHPIFDFLYNARVKTFSILQDRSMSLWKRMRLILDYGEALQEQINNNNYSELLYEPIDRYTQHKGLTDFFALLLELDILNASWEDHLNAVYEREGKNHLHTIDEIKGERLAIYFIYRYFLKGAFDCDVLSKLKLALISVMAIAALENTIGDLAECARLYSIEIEHDEDNIDAIYDEFMFCENLSMCNIINMIS